MARIIPVSYTHLAQRIFRPGGRGIQRDGEYEQPSPVCAHHGLQRRQQHQAAHREQRLTAYDDVDVQQVQKRQPERIKRMLAQREPIVFSQPVPGGDALGKVEHQRVVDGGKIRRGDDELEACLLYTSIDLTVK